MSGLPRELLKWIQSLDLTWQVKTPKWDLTNGYIIAEIFSWYFPQEIQMHMYNNGTSLDSKLRNWSLLKNFFKKHRFEIPEEFVEGTIHCKEGAAPLLVERIYEILTQRSLQGETSSDFTDRAYQEKLPIHARSTASQAVKNNIRITELMADKDIILGQQKSQTIINDHIMYRRQERADNPERFDRKATIGELALRSSPPPNSHYTQETTESRTQSANYSTKEERPQDIPYKEIQVQQLGKESYATACH